MKIIKKYTAPGTMSVLLSFFFLLTAQGSSERFESALRRALDADAGWTMTKTQEDSPIVVRASGSVSCVKGKGIFWKEVYPLRREMAMDAEGFFLCGENGARFEVKPPRYQDIRRAVDVFLQGGQAPFGELFEEVFSESGGVWRVVLTPKRADMRRIVESVTVSGKETIAEARFGYASGETAVFRFTEKSRRGGAVLGGGK